MMVIAWRCMRCVLLYRYWAICVGHENQRGFCSVFSKYRAIYCCVEVFTISADFLLRPDFVNLTNACDILSTHHKSWWLQLNGWKHWIILAYIHIFPGVFRQDISIEKYWSPHRCCVYPQMKTITIIHMLCILFATITFALTSYK